MLIDFAAFPPTVTLILTDTLLFAVTVIIAEPDFNALTLPVWLTETILGLLDIQVSIVIDLLLVTGTTPSVADEPFFKYTFDCDTAMFISFFIGV